MIEGYVLGQVGIQSRRLGMQSLRPMRGDIQQPVQPIYH